MYRDDGVFLGVEVRKQGTSVARLVTASTLQDASSSVERFCSRPTMKRLEDLVFVNGRADQETRSLILAMLYVQKFAPTESWVMGEDRTKWDAEMGATLEAWERFCPG